jgi:U3 small nucleolar ribonucleoprotein protein IMP4
MLRRNARLRKEYLYRKSLEGKEKATYERKRAVRKALDGECAPGWWGLLPRALPPSCPPASHHNHNHT